MKRRILPGGVALEFGHYPGGDQLKRNVSALMCKVCGQATNNLDIKLLRRRVYDGVIPRENIARLKRERRRRLKLSLLDFFLCFVAFFLVFVNSLFEV